MHLGKFGSMKILIHPDLFFNEQSGAVAARTAGKLLAGMGFKIGVFTHDNEIALDFDCTVFTRIKYTGTAHYFSKKYKDSFIRVLDAFNPDFIFFIGGIISTPTIYLHEARKRSIKTVFLLLVQDFYCTRMHAALGYNSCQKCLSGSVFNSLKNNCLEKGRSKYLYFLNYLLIQAIFLPEVKKLTWVLGSTDEQLSFYEKIGVEKSRCFKIPLFFDPERIQSNHFESQDYFVFLAQNRLEKGINLLPEILKYIRNDIKIKALFYSEQEARQFQLNHPHVGLYIEKGNLEILPGVTMQNGAVEILSKSRAVLNLSIWATTTEFVFLEILGLKKAMIAFDVGIHKETILHRINGCLVKAGEFQSFANEISYLKDNKDDAELIGKNGFDLFLRLTSETMFKEKLKTIFK